MYKIRCLQAKMFQYGRSNDLTSESYIFVRISKNKIETFGNVRAVNMTVIICIL